MSVDVLGHDDKGAVSVLFAAAAVPIVGLLGLAIDMSFITQAKSQLTLAADTAAMNAAKLASNEYINLTPAQIAAGNTTYMSDGVNNANQWFQAQLGNLRGIVGLPTLEVNPATGTNVTFESFATSSASVQRSGNTFTAQVSYSATVPAYFTSMFGVRTFPVSGQSTATITTNAYINIELFLDNSGSMLIGASTADINELQALTACSPEAGGSGQGASAWSTTPIPATCPTTYATSTSSPGEAAVAGKAPNTANCGFACHWATDNGLTGADSTSGDYYYLARNVATSAYAKSQGYTANPTLRFDVVQSAAATVVGTMQSSEIIANQFGLGVWEFNSNLTRVYPATGEASTDLTDGLTAIKAIQTYQGPNGGDTDFPDELNALAGNLTKAGDGSSAGSPEKVLIMVTDGVQDYGSRDIGDEQGPFSNTAAVNACNTIKGMGISIYVLYTPYNPLPYNPYYVSNISQFVNGATATTPNKIVQALQACASAPTDFYEADIPSQITSGLTSLLQAAIRTPARITS